MTASVGIVATVREPVWIVESFLRYHLQRGFAHIFLFFDDPLDPAIEVARRYKNVSAIPCDDALRDRHRRCQRFHSIQAFYHEIMARQILNAEIALSLAARMGLDWLLHIDGDELFYTSGDISEHFEFIPSSVGLVSYRNFEGIPETWESHDYFREVTLFKKHEHLVPPGSAATYCRALDRTIYWLGYGNGKSATRVLPGVLPSGVHLFTLPSSHPEIMTSSGGPVILHYINCGFNYYCHKYQRLGADSWLGVPIPFAFYIQSRRLTGNPSGLADLYRREVLVDDPDKIEDLIAQGILMRITTPSDVLGAKLMVSPGRKSAADNLIAEELAVRQFATVIRTDEAAERTSPGINHALVEREDQRPRLDAFTSPEWIALRSEHPWPTERPSVIPERNHGWLRTSVRELLERKLTDQTHLIVELGSWLGLSTRFILKAAPKAAVIAIDHWKGSPEHFKMPDAAKLLPQLFETFLVNCWESQETLLPLRMSTQDGLNLVAARGLQPDLIYIDADHAYEAVKADLQRCLDLFPQATIVGDDWDWIGVRQAVEDVCRARNIAVQVHGVGWSVMPA